MNKSLAAILLAFIFASALYAADPPPGAPAAQTPKLPGDALSAPPPAEPPKPGKDTAPPQSKPPELVITGLLYPPINAGVPPKTIQMNDKSTIGLNDELWIQVAAKETTGSPLSVDASKYAVFFNGSEIKGLGAATFRTFKAEGGTDSYALAFKLIRNSDNKTFWNELLGSPTGTHIPVSVALAARDSNGKALQPTNNGSPEQTTFRFQVISGVWAAIAAILALIVVIFVFVYARKRTTLRDNLLPQIPASRQTYSLARWQMAFWFTLIFTSFIALYIVLWDYNTISAQALTLMGISGGTALAAVAIDAVKDSPADAVNRGLRALGLNNYDDVVRVKQEIAVRETELQSNPPPSAQRIAQLQIEILDRQNILRTYEDKIRPFVSEGWFKDLTSDLNGTAVHRLQVFCWTWVLGFIFLIGVYRDLAMPEFGNTLLALMAISSAGYVGFKYPEKNN
jgi:hypothetical protein